MITREANRYFIEGPVTLHNVEQFIANGATFEGTNPVVDFARVTTVDSSAVSLMLEWIRHFNSTGRKISFINLTPSLRSLAELYGVIDLIPVVGD
jgi:phospholipid transport system transporter-binding protein